MMQQCDVSAQSKTLLKLRGGTVRSVIYLFIYFFHSWQREWSILNWWLTHNPVVCHFKWKSTTRRSKTRPLGFEHDSGESDGSWRRARISSRRSDVSARSRNGVWQRDVCGSAGEGGTFRLQSSRLWPLQDEWNTAECIFISSSTDC